MQGNRNVTNTIRMKGAVARRSAVSEQLRDLLLDLLQALAGRPLCASNETENIYEIATSKSSVRES